MSIAARAIFEQYKKDDAILQVNEMVGKEFENHLLDFKEMRTDSNGDLADSDRTTYSIALSGFGNSDGGVIVWGVECKPTSKDGRDVVQSLKPVKPLSKIIYALRRLEPSMTSPAISGIEHTEVEQIKGSDSGFIATYVPKVEALPVMAMGKDTQRMYYRGSHSFSYMPHWMVADRFSRRPQPKLEMDWFVQEEYPDGVKLQIVTKNIGRGIALHSSFTLKHTKYLSLNDYSYAGVDRDFILALRDKQTVGWAKPGNVLHPKQYIQNALLNFPLRGYGVGDRIIPFEISCDGFFEQGEMLVTLNAVENHRRLADLQFD
ncbi:MAG: ATP-binding protein [Candidatus Melainabacteria bacterium]|nr:MAG: ATP-binding protein [Candidatus Melainabacteria bacterium]